MINTEPHSTPQDMFAGAHPESETFQEDEAMGEVAKMEPAKVPVAVTPMALVEMAVAQNADIDKLTKLMDLADRWQANQARQAFNAAKAAFQAEAPTINKTRTGHNTKYAGLAETLEQVRDLMSMHGLTHSWQTKQDGNLITVTCFLTHTDGHQESTSLSAAPDGTGQKNAIQAVGSTVSYLQRYTLFAVLGLASRETDDDGVKGGGVITDEQKQTLVDLMRETNADTAKFLQYLRVPSIDELPAGRFNEARQALEAKRGKA